MHAADSISYPPFDNNCVGNRYCRLGGFAPLRRQCFETPYANPCTGQPAAGSQLFVPSDSKDPRAYLSDVRPHFGNVTEEFPGVSCRWTQATRANAIYSNECPSGKIENGYCVAKNCSTFEFDNDNPKAIRAMSLQEVLDAFPIGSTRDTVLYYLHLLSRGIQPRLWLCEFYDWTTGTDRRQKLRAPAVIISTPIQSQPQCRRSMASLWRGTVLAFQAAGQVESAKEAATYEAGFLYNLVMPDGTFQEMAVVVEPSTLAAAKLALSQLAGKCT